MQLKKAPTSRKKEHFWLMQTLVSVLSAMVILLTAAQITGLTQSGIKIAVAAVCIWLGVLYGILLKSRHENWFYTGILTLDLIVTLICRKQILEGFRLCWNQADAAMVKGTGWVLPKWQLQFGTQQSSICVFLFAGLISTLICLFCCMLISAAPVVQAVLLPLAALTAAAVFGTEISAGQFWPVLAVSAAVLLYGGWHKEHMAAPVVLNWFVFALTTVLLMTAVSLPGIQDLTEKVHKNTHRLLHEKKYETKYTTLPEGDFSDYQKKERKPQQALAVTMEVPQTMYLRGFTGAEFDGESWRGLDKEVLAKNKDLLYGVNLNVFDQNAQYEAAAVLAKLPQNTVTVQNIGACSYYRYIPFNIAAGSWTQPENLNTDGVCADGERSYMYLVTGESGADIMQVLNVLQTSENPEVLTYRRAESGYRQFIYCYYLQIPDSVRELLQKRWNELAGRYGTVNSLTRQQAQDCAITFLSECFPKEGTPKEMELPLACAEGTSFRFATVAAMTLRYFGIPARYAEGYVISADMAADYGSGETMTVDSSCARAWVEIYQDGIGWIPMEMTAGMSEVMENQDSSGSDGKSGSSAQSMSEKEKEEENEQEEQTQQDEKLDGTKAEIFVRSLLTGLVILLLILMLVFLALWIRRKILLDRKHKLFADENRNDAAAWMYADAAVLLTKLGFDRGNGSMRVLGEPLEERFGTEFKEIFVHATDVNDRALFGNKPVEETELEVMLNFHVQTLEKLKSEVKWYKRIWLKWVICLY